MDKIKVYDVKQGDIGKFGRYYQSDTLSKEDIEWRILEVEDGKALLLSEMILDCKQYNEELEEVTWETCTLRAWLNDDFYKAAFSLEEQARIALINVKNEDNPWDGTEGGKNTQDKVFLLSYSEVTNSAFGFSSPYSNYDVARQAYGTVYARSNGLYAPHNNSDFGNSPWWLRSPGDDPNSAGFIFRDSSLGYNSVSDTYIGVRPALWLNL